MAIKMDRQVDAVDITYFLNETAEKGVILSISTAGSGIALDSPTNLATVSASPSGAKPLGMLLQDFVNIDETAQNLNAYKDQAQVGSKCTAMTKGWAVTNKVLGTATAGQFAVLAESGNVRGTALNTNVVANPTVGRFRTTKDEAGYIRLYMDL